MSIYREWIISRTKKFRRHFHCKINSLALSLLFLPIIALATNGDASANVVVNKVNTKVALFFDNKDINFETDAFDVKGAISSKNIELGENDVTEPSFDTKLNGGEITVKIKRALPLLLDDNGKKSVIYSGYEDVTSILMQNNIKLYPEDTITDSIITDFFSDQSVGRKIVVERAPVLYVNVDGDTKELRSWEKTVGEAINENGILVGDKDKAEPRLGTYLTNKVAVTITRVAESEVREEEVISFETQTISDYNLNIGEGYIKQLGKNGKKENTFKIISENGAMVSKTLLSSVVLSGSQIEIRVVGKKPINANDYWGTIAAASGMFGVDASKMYRVMLCESGGNRFAGGYYKGLFQYAPDTWSGASATYPGGAYAGASIYDVTAQIYVTAWKASRQGWGAWGCQ
ncbi:hypothetical protein COY62_04170 [bacterium (Candidatus Howlettbacteria) CG_4_10_14_0_8_um_filter_40_9]|nr:MAG: hypothetical protein COY62_04170 [bacterium (Candidatus Howlettbacteria) CG_4_10_14_0_8_um_filter_40_9]